MALGRPRATLVVTALERETLEQWARRPKTAQALPQRARIVLTCATGASNTTVAADALRARCESGSANGPGSVPVEDTPRSAPAGARR